MKYSDSYILPGNDCAGKIVLGNPFQLASCLNVKDFVADHIDHLAAIDFGSVYS